MSDTTSFIGANEPNKQDAGNTSSVSDVYIGVFFDGTNNNTLWKAKEAIGKYLKKSNEPKSSDEYEKVKAELKKAKKIYNDSTRITNKEKFIEVQSVEDKCKVLSKNESEFKKFLDKQDDDIKNELEGFEGCKKGYERERCKDCPIMKRIKTLNDFLVGLPDKEWDKEKILMFNNSHYEFPPSHYGSFSNIAILYSIYSPEFDKNHNVREYHLYIEGAGATDLTGKTPRVPEILEKININGLGFGLGKTGVVALVSKAVFYITNYINSIKGEFQGKVTIHFNIFGFSRGSACSRLFAYIASRNKKEKLKEREKEFADFYAKGLYDEINKRIPFLEDEEYTKVVDFLGIYDTVASIGFLKQKDGYVNPKRIAYSQMPNYKDNWHYKNVNEYGMYSTSSKYNESHNIKNICHICAMDEYRENFALTDLGETISSNAVEIFIPGCHSDVGGGYYDADEEQEIFLENYHNKRALIEETKSNTSQERVKKERVNHFISDFPYQPYVGESGKEKFSSTLFKIGWIDENWNKSTRKMITILGKEVPCTIRVVDSDKTIKFKRNVLAGYSNIPLRMMRQYAESRLLTPPIPSPFYLKLFNDNKIFNEEYPVPNDLIVMNNKILEIIKKDNRGKRLWLHPNNYKALRMNYLHFTSTETGGRELIPVGHFSNPMARDVKMFEGSAGNIANTPNFDSNGRLCRIIYHGDKTPEISYSDIKYMYEYIPTPPTPISSISIIVDNIPCDIKLQSIEKIDKDNDIMKNMC